MIDWLRANAAEALNGALVVLVAVLVAVGRVFGRRPESGKTVELAGAVIDSAAVKALIASQENLAAAMRENSEATRNTAAGLPAIAAGVARVVMAVEESNERLEDIKDKAIEAVARMGR